MVLFDFGSVRPRERGSDKDKRGDEARQATPPELRLSRVDVHADGM